MSKELFRTVCCWDPAIDHERSDTATYHDTRDFTLLRFLSEKRPVVFYLRELDTRAVNRYVLPASTDAEQRERAFRAAVVRVDGLVHDDGRVEDGWEPKRVERTRKDARVTDTYELVSDDELAAFDAATVQEIGEVARELLEREPGTWTHTREELVQCAAVCVAWFEAATGEVPCDLQR